MLTHLVVGKYLCYNCAFFMENIEENICRSFSMLLKLVLTATVFLLIGCFIFGGAKSLEKLRVRYLS